MGKQWKQWQTLFSWTSKITADGDWSHEIKRRLLLERKAMTNLDSVLKSRDIILMPKVCILKAMVFPVVMYRYESWTYSPTQKVEHQRTAGFELWCWRRLLRSPWTARRSNQSILHLWIFIGRTDVKAEAPILGPPNAKSYSLQKTLMLGKIESGRRNRWQRMRWLDGITHWLNGHKFAQTPGDGEG